MKDSHLDIKNLRTELKTNPVGIDRVSPRLSWEVLSEQRGTVQTFYQVICSGEKDFSETAEKLLWNSGKTESDQSTHIYYTGPALTKGQRVFWKVKVWDNKGNESDWSETAFWQSGLIDNKEWVAKWIEPDISEDVSHSTPSPYLRKEFNCDKTIEKATVYITSHGLFELNLNGEKVSDELFTPGWTSYQHRLQYKAFDVTEIIQNGNNAMGVILGDGWYRGYFVWEGNKNLYGDKLALLLQLEITYTDGSTAIVCSDESWKSSTVAILCSDIYNGEHYNAELEINDWNKAGFNDAKWSGVTLKDFGVDNIVPSEGAPVRITEEITPIEKIITPKGELVFDLGQNIAGWVRFTLKGKKGDKITLNHAEVLDQEGNFYVENLREAKAEDSYIFKGNDLETWEPRFTFHGFRYIMISDYLGTVECNDLTGCVVHSDMTPTGNFECSNDLINRLQKNIQWGLRDNFLDVPTDCPQRDERLGWTGDAQVFAPTACFNMDASSFYRKWMQDFIPDQKADGSVPWVVPNVVKDGGGTGWSDGFGSTGWSDAAVIIPWTVYKVYGDTQILKDQYISMKGWTDFMIKESGDSYIFSSGFHFGDWLSFAEYYSYYYNAPDYGYAGAYTEKELCATAYFYYTTSLMVKIAELTGNNEDAATYKSILPKIKAAYADEFLTKKGRLTSNSQTAYILSLAFGLLDEDMNTIGAQRLADDVNHFGHLTTGFLGTPLICHALTENGYPDIAYKLLFNERYPSWLYPVTKGATTIWERWDCIKPDGSFQTAGMNSFNHYAYGAVGDWLYSYVAGLKQSPESVGYKHIIIEPYLTDQLSYAKADFDSVYGKIISGWKRDGNKLVFEITIPTNTSATVKLPCPNSDKISENGVKISESEDFCLLEKENDRTVFEIESGVYTFEILTN